MFVKLLIISSVFLVIAVAGLAIRILLYPRGRFPETHISRNKEMRRRGITCAQETDIGCVHTGQFTGCAYCSSVKL